MHASERGPRKDNTDSIMNLHLSSLVDHIPTLRGHTRLSYTESLRSHGTRMSSQFTSCNTSNSLCPSGEPVQTCTSKPPKVEFSIHSLDVLDFKQTESKMIESPSQNNQAKTESKYQDIESAKTESKYQDIESEISIRTRLPAWPRLWGATAFIAERDSAGQNQYLTRELQQCI